MGLRVQGVRLRVNKEAATSNVESAPVNVNKDGSAKVPGCSQIQNLKPSTASSKDAKSCLVCVPFPASRQRCLKVHGAVVSRVLRSLSKAGTRISRATPNPKP